jgi:protease-4
MMSVKKLSKIFGLIIASTSFSAPWNGGIEVGTSVAQSYGARNLFTNPAAISFEKELNGSGLLSSFTYGSTFNQQNEFSLSGTFNFLGFGYERLTKGSDYYSRYQLGISSSISQDLFWGAKISTTSSDNSVLSNHFSLDAGFQYRPLSYLSLGLIVNEINQSTINGIKSSSVYTLGAAIRPKDWATLSFDIETNSDNFGKAFTYQTTLAIEPIQGLTLSSGYQSDQRFQVGMQLDLGRASLFSVIHTQPKETVKGNSPHYTIGFQTSAKPFKSGIRPASELSITLDDSVTEEGREGNFLSKPKPSLLEVLESIKSANESSTVEKITVNLQSFPLGLAAAEELTEALLKARENGKKVEVFLPSAKMKEFVIASAANTIYLEPSGEILLLGPRVGHYFAKGTLDKIGVEGEFIAKGDYKSAPETFTRKESSPKSREASQHELKEMETVLLSLLQRTRKVTPNQWQTWLKHALFSSEDAIQQKLIDKIDSYSNVKNQETSGPSTVPGVQWASKRMNLPDRVAVINAEGSILDKRNRFLSISGQTQVTPESLAPLFQRAVKDPRTKAIVLRVSSPGGEVLASEQIANLVSQAKNKKPVIVSMGDVAASGGYFISAPASTIYADRLTLTGSIGVFLGKFNLGGLYRKLDLRKEVDGFGPYPGLDSEHKAWTQEERAIMQRRLNQYYESFIQYVAQQRNISKEAAQKAGQGRVWLGSESTDLKIVDKHGGLLDAIEGAKKQAKLSDDFIIYPVRESMSLVDAIAAETTPSIFLFSDLQKELAKLAWLKEHPFLYLAD